MIDVRSKIFFVYHIKSNNHIWILWSFKYSINLLLNVVFTNNLKATCDDFHLEKREHLLDNLLDLFKNGKLSFETDCTFFIKYHSKNVFPFDNSNTLFNQIFAYSIQYHLKELCVIIKLICHHEFWLEVFPDFVMLLGVDTISQKYGFM